MQSINVTWSVFADILRPTRHIWFITGKWSSSSHPFLPCSAGLIMPGDCGSNLRSLVGHLSACHGTWGLNGDKLKWNWFQRAEACGFYQFLFQSLKFLVGAAGNGMATLQCPGKLVRCHYTPFPPATADRSWISSLHLLTAIRMQSDRPVHAWLTLWSDINSLV